jgi:hypothetical protein
MGAAWADRSTNNPIIVSAWRQEFAFTIVSAKIFFIFSYFLDLAFLMVSPAQRTPITAAHGRPTESLDFQQKYYRQQHGQNEPHDQDHAEAFALWVIYPVGEDDG